MGKIIFFVTFFLIFAVQAGGQVPYTTTGDDRTEISITIYSRDLALIKDRRMLSIPEGRTNLEFRDVSAELKPQTALLSGKGLEVLEQNFEFDLLTPETLLKEYVGKEVTVVKSHPTTGEESRQKAVVLSVGKGVVLRMGDHIETGVPGRLIFQEVPEELETRPNLAMMVDYTPADNREMELRYLTAGLDWKADYVAELHAEEKAFDLKSWATMTNQSGVDYPDAMLQLVAGEVNQVHEERAESGGYGRLMARAPEMKSMAEEKLFEYHLYRVGRPVTLKNGQSKQVALLQADGIPCRKEFILQGSSRYYRGQHGEIGRKIRAGVYVEADNSKKSNLGRPLPGGIVRVYKRDAEGGLQFIGENRIDHTPENEIIRLKLGEAFDITADKVQTDFKKLSGFSRYHYVYESAYRIEVKNAGEEAVTVKVVEPVPGDWEILEESHLHEKKASNKAIWRLEVPEEGESVLTYRIKVSY